MPWGAVLESDGVWTALVETTPRRSFGQALVLATRHNAPALELLVEAASAGDVARRAALFEPTPVVWSIEDTSLRPAVASSLDQLEPPELRPDLAELLLMPEVDTVVEHGCIVAECRGVEVARITGHGDEQRLDVGVGAYDQGAFAVMNPGLTSKESLAEVVAQVLRYRTRGAEPHPINRLVRERWLRSELIADPTVIGLERLTPVEGPEQREGLYDVQPAFAVDRGADVLVACSVGIDLDLIPAAADVASREGATRIVVVAPSRDMHSVTVSVSERCRIPVEFHAADEPWPTA